MKDIYEICSPIKDKKAVVVNKAGYYTDSIYNIQKNSKGELSQIVFTYTNDVDSKYWEKPWIKACTISQKRLNPDRIIYINIDDDILNINGFSRKRYFRNFNTDPLRLIFICFFGNSFYVDSDVYITDHDAVMKNIPDFDKNRKQYYSTFTYGSCTGNFVYNLYPNRKELLEWIEWYDKIGVVKGDIEAWNEFGKSFCFNYPKPKELVHFSYFYPYYDNNITMYTIDSEDIKIFKKDWISVPMECKIPLLQYLEAKKGIVKSVLSEKEIPSDSPLIIFNG